MEAIRKIIDATSSSITIELPESFENKKLEVIVLPIEEGPKAKLSDFFGKLQWNGDALTEQRKLRDEWE